jgi:oxaloacetate decarboxylase alpha subunit
MKIDKKPLELTEVVFRDGSQSLLATRLKLDDILPIAEKVDDIGFYSVESWGGATFDACIRFLAEDPWERIREIKKVMPKTRQQMLFRGQNILGYRHYADDVVKKFVERAAESGIEIFRVFDALNDIRNMTSSIAAVGDIGMHAQGTLSYTTSPVHTIETWIDLAKSLEDAGANSICIKDMAGLLTPYNGYELVCRLKKAVSVPLQLHAHATTGMSTATILKCCEAGIDRVDTSISSMSLTYGHSPTESVIAILKGHNRDTGLSIENVEVIAQYFREVRKKYSHFEGSLKGIDSRILTAQVPGGMLTNMENQLKEQGASDRLSEVLEEIPQVREDLGYIPLVTPTSQIVGTQSVLNVLTGDRYKSIAKETADILKGAYGKTPAPVNKKLQKKVLDVDEKVIACRPADLLSPELSSIEENLESLSHEMHFDLMSGESRVDDVLTYALFPNVAIDFFKNRSKTEARSEPMSSDPIDPNIDVKTGIYTVEVNAKTYVVKVSSGGDISKISERVENKTTEYSEADGTEINAPLAGNVIKVNVQENDNVQQGDSMIILEAMKMETSISAPIAGRVKQIRVKSGDTCAAGQLLLVISC